MTKMWIQELIHRFEEGPWSRYVKRVLFGCLIVTLMVLYDVRAYRNFSNPEAMDAAQLARNIAQGKGYTTDVVRPFSMYLLMAKQQREDADPLIRQRHPDLANPPLYPLLLAGILKAAAPNYIISRKAFTRFAPEFLIALFSQGLFLLLVFLVYRLARRLFGAGVAWMSVVLILGTLQFWQFSVSGLSTMLLMVVFVGLIWAVVLLEEAASIETGQSKKLVLRAALTGLIVGLGALTRYSFGWLIVPVLVFLAVYLGKDRAKLCLAAAAAFLVVLAPWMARNYLISRTPFGTATYTIMETTAVFPGDTLQRTLEPPLRAVSLSNYGRKLVANTKEILRNDLPKMGGNWISAFFLVALMVPFRDPRLNRLRMFLVLCGVVLIPVQALGRTFLSNEIPEINSDNLLILLAPLVFVYGVSFYFSLLDQVALPFPELRYAINGLFFLVLSAPLLFALPPRPNPYIYPPYWPPAIQTSAGWLKEKEMMMSDIPWAVAWYGGRQCIWLTANYRQEFFKINDFLKPVNALYLTRRTTDKPFFTEWMSGALGSWERNFLMESLAKSGVPPGFPLRVVAEVFWPKEIFLTDFERWKKFGN